MGDRNSFSCRQPTVAFARAVARRSRSPILLDPGQSIGASFFSALPADHGLQVRVEWFPLLGQLVMYVLLPHARRHEALLEDLALSDCYFVVLAGEEVARVPQACLVLARACLVAGRSWLALGFEGYLFEDGDPVRLREARSGASLLAPVQDFRVLRAARHCLGPSDHGGEVSLLVFSRWL